MGVDADDVAVEVGHGDRQTGHWVFFSIDRGWMSLAALARVNRPGKPGDFGVSRVLWGSAGCHLMPGIRWQQWVNVGIRRSSGARWMICWRKDARSPRSPTTWA